MDVWLRLLEGKLVQSAGQKNKKLRILEMAIRPELVANRDSRVVDEEFRGAGQF